jgi:hypothetical protein
LLCSILAWGAYQLIERPCMKLGRKLESHLIK